ncbi:hypothetical protein [Sphaerotilus sp.]|jgi:hypothetical protein|uniref:hypothetical protein n=1 Tax=Sphaerotilus sp. TaxID=2093942 RepID=UPI00286DDA03|nr:hypothetical protein [Sphaerotilus sp.]
MATQALSLRRRAAYAVLSPLLEEDALLDALRMQHLSMRGDSVSDIIGYIDQVAARHNIDAASRKKLYEAYFKALKQPEGELPMDPWPLMQIGTPAAPAPAPVAPAPVSAAALEPVAAAMQAAAPTLPAAPAGPPATPDRAVCGELLRSAMAEVQRFHSTSMTDLRSSALQQIDQGGLSQPVRKQAREAWGQPMQATWVIDGTPAELSQLVHQFYVALCEALGPVDADQVLTRAVRAAEQIPAARQFSPRKLI